MPAANSIVIRISFAILLFAAIAVAPWWAALLSIGACFLAFRSYYEGVIACFLMDILYGAPPGFFFPLPFTALGIVAALAAPAVKQRLAFWKPSGL